MEEYLKLLIEQIRCKKAQPFIRQEIQGHILDQIEANMLEGMTREEAEENAVKDMGNPVETGISLDRIHRPQIAWSMIALMAGISLAGIILHCIISRQLGAEAMGSSDFTMYTIIGFILMLLVYRIDYSMLARFSKIIAALLLGIFVFALFEGTTIEGTIRYIKIAGCHIPLLSLMMLYVPLYGAVIYKYHGRGYDGFIKALLWMLIPVFAAFRLPSISFAALLLVSMSAVLTSALAHDWFCVAKRRVIAILWICEIGLPVGGLFCALLFGLLADYQSARIKAFFTSSGDANYITAQLRTILTDSQLIGNSGKNLTEYLPNFNSDYILSYVFSTYGFLFGAILCCALVILIVKIFSITFQQKNQLGMSMGCGCCMVLLLNIAINIGECMGLLPITQTFLPFISSGGSSILTCYILMGIILSIYRYKNIYPSHISTELPKINITIGL